jgi:hypothetical protein
VVPKDKTEDEERKSKESNPIKEKVKEPVSFNSLDLPVESQEGDRNNRTKEKVKKKTPPLVLALNIPKFLTQNDSLVVIGESSPKGTSPFADNVRNQLQINSN